MAGLPSEAAGPAFLSILLIAACIIAWRRRNLPAPQSIVPVAALALALQALHAAEEFGTGFHLRVPPLVGLDPWSDTFFVGFNLAAIAIWCVALGAAAHGRLTPLTLAPLWFLALACVGNGVWHPLLALLTAGYFPGLVTSLAMAFVGPAFVRRLLTSEPAATPS